MYYQVRHVSYVKDEVFGQHNPTTLSGLLDRNDRYKYLPIHIFYNVRWVPIS
jgi:hypothetical protein